jgi:hypothetical protein
MFPDDINDISHVTPLSKNYGVHRLQFQYFHFAKIKLDRKLAILTELAFLRFPQ